MSTFLPLISTFSQIKMNLEQLLEKYPILKMFPNLPDIVAHVHVLVSDNGVLFCDSVQGIPIGYKEITVETQQSYLVQYYKFGKLCMEEMSQEALLKAMPEFDVTSVYSWKFKNYEYQQNKYVEVEGFDTSGFSFQVQKQAPKVLYYLH